MRKQKKRSDSRGYPISRTNLKSSEETFLLRFLEDICQRLKTEYNYSTEELFEIYSKESEGKIMVPISIFSTDLCPSEALTKYLKEKYGLNYHEISELINRNERGIWANYQRAIKKKGSPFQISKSIFVPVSIFKDNKLSILECLVFYLKENMQIKNSKIAELLNKNSSNIWIVYNRAKTKKRGKK